MRSVVAGRRIEVEEVISGCVAKMLLYLHPIVVQWDFSASFLADLDSSHVWDDTLERQHFGPLKDLLTTGDYVKPTRLIAALVLVLSVNRCTVDAATRQF
ncbi:hypothetical protein DICVIV_01577 [Dictyocaulus viviparus]|uniref:Uncharacterized protein n=1 Tax=Dictyocaulus viviparus TaxID=29172 RepID=A0A0D8Y8F0_DICVI|nr:hypothetical protein DICVIV_01577 [Dictyocaulus viviparus]